VRVSSCRCCTGSRSASDEIARRAVANATELKRDQREGAVSLQ
jgi:hypothetical protein